MALKDNATMMGADVSIVPAAARAATATGSGVDLLGYESATVIVLTGTVTDGTGTFSIDESADNSNWTAVAAADIVGTAPVIDTTASHDNAGFTFGYRGSKRYIRVVCTAAGTTTGAVYCAGVIRSTARHNPVSSP
jgi:hypothetical protein